MVASLALPPRPAEQDQPERAGPARKSRSKASPNDAAMIRELVDTAYNDTLPLRLRQIGDYRLYRLEPFTWRQIMRDRMSPNAATVTSNEPRTLADTIIAIMDDSRLSFRSPTVDQREEVRDAGRAAEQLIHGMLQQVERRRPLMVQPSFKGQLSFHIAVRGFACVLHTLFKNQKGETMVKMEAWDPLNVYWSVASGEGDDDYHGLAWVCHYQDLDSWRLDSRFSKEYGRISGDLTPTYERNGKPMFRVYDYYDRENNIVMADDKIVTKQPHYGEGYVPATVVPVGPSGLIVDSQSSTSYVEDFGQSIFSHNRELYPKLNAFLSTKYERMLRVVNPAVKLPSATGRFAINPNIANPFDRGQRIGLNTTNQEDIIPLDQPDIPRDAIELEASLQSQLQKGGVPNVVHGQGNDSISGYNTALLTSAGQRHILAPRLKAMQETYMSIGDFLLRQFASGYFEAMHIQGEIDRRTPYSRVIEPALIRQAPALSYTCKIKNPAELPTRIGMATAMGSGPDPFFDLMYILDEIMEVDDPDAMMERLALQKAKRAIPETQLYEAIKAAEEIGDETAAKLLMGALMRFMQGPPLLPGQQVGRGQPAGRGGGGGPAGGQRPPGPTTAGGGAPGAGQPNPSGPEQGAGRSRPPGVR